MIEKAWFSVFLIRFILATMGVSLKNDKLRYLNHISLVLFFNTASIAGQIMLLSYTQDRNVIWITVNNLVHCMNYFATWVILYYKRRCLVKIMSAFEINIYQYPDHMLKFKPSESTSILPTLTLFVTSYLSYTIILLAPLAFQIIKKLPPSANGLMFPCWFPWTIDSFEKYVLSYALQLCSGFCSCWFMPGNIVFVMHFVFITQEQCQIMNGVLRNIKNFNVRPNQQQSRSEFSDVQFRRDLIECMKHHSALIKFISYFVSCYKWIFVLNLLYSTSIFTINCYIMITGDHNLAKFAQTVLELSMVFPYFFVYCYIGEIFKDVNNMMQFSIYDINWYDESLKFRKLISFLLSLTKPEINLKYSPHSVASYALFASVLRTSYTYANLMLNMQSDNAKFDGTE